MPATSYLDFLKQKNAMLQESQGSTVVQAQLGKLQEIQAFIDLNGGNHTLLDYPGSVTIINASTAVARSSTIDYGHDFYHKASLVRIVTTIGATPSATLAIQGSNDGSSWSNVNYADFSTPGTVVATNLTITTATTLVKLVPERQNFRYLSVNVSADTNVTITVDVTMLG